MKGADASFFIAYVTRKTAINDLFSALKDLLTKSSKNTGPVSVRFSHKIYTKGDRA